MDGSQTSASEELVTSSDQTEHSTTEDDESSYDSDAKPGEKRKSRTTLRNVKKMRTERETSFENVVQNVRGQLRDGGYVLFIQDDLSSGYPVLRVGRNKLIKFAASNIIHKNGSVSFASPRLPGMPRTEKY